MATHGKNAPTLTQARLKKLLKYDPTTGVFCWRVARGGAVKAGQVAGYVSVSGYRAIGVDSRQYLEHRLAWLYVTGAFPVQDTDHIDGNKTNNRISNLRDVSRSVNCQNQRRAKSQNKSGYLGVRVEGKRWSAVIQASGNAQRHLGTFDSPEQAHEIYVAAKRALHAGCTI